MFTLFHHFENYRDFEPSGHWSEHTPFGSLCRVTFNDQDHTAYGSIANPKYAIENDEELSTGETVDIPWDDALKLVAA